MLERKDLRLKLSPDDHAGLQAIADLAQQDMAEWAETILAQEIRRRIHDAILLAETAKRLGLTGNRPDSGRG